MWNRHQYFHFSPARANHNKLSVVFNQTFRISRLCSNVRDFEQNKNKIKSWFVKRGYPKALIDSKMVKIKFNIKETNKKNKKRFWRLWFRTFISTLELYLKQNQRYIPKRSLLTSFFSNFFQASTGVNSAMPSPKQEEKTLNSAS